MTVLSLWQPWATLLVVGAKKIETRGRPFSHRGPLLIHATKAFPSQALLLCSQEPFCTTLFQAGVRGLAGLPRGEIVGVVNMTRCFQFTGAFNPGEPERSFGDFTPGRWGYVLDKAHRFKRPIPANGHQGPWTFEVAPELLPEWAKLAPAKAGAGLF